MQPGKIYHIYNHGNANDNLFRSDENYRYFLQKYGEFTQSTACTYAFNLLPNHFHFLIKINEEAKLTALDSYAHLSTQNLEKKIVKTFSNFFNAYTKSFNKVYDRRGKLFLSPFKRKPVTNRRQLINTWKYIHFNAVHHGLVDHPLEWPHSSIHDYLLKKSKWVVLIKEVGDIELKTLKDFMPDWNDFLDFDY